MDALARDDIRAIDRRAIAEYGIPGIVLMENAARGATDILLARRPANARSCMIVCGGGNNGGDGFAIARHASNAGLAVTLMMTRDADALSGDAATNYHIARRMDVPMVRFDGDAGARFGGHDIIVDALLGTGFAGRVRPPLDGLIEAINGASAWRVAIDVPSGLDCDAGTVDGVAVRADLTITFVAPKLGFGQATAREYVGEVVVAGIGAPRELIEEYLKK